MPSRLVISNTSPLFYLHQINRLDLLQTLYGQIMVPAAVQRELQAGQAQGLSVPLVETLGWVTLAAAKASFLPNVTDLGEGEAEVIALGMWITMARWSLWWSGWLGCSAGAVDGSVEAAGERGEATDNGEG